MQMQAIGFPCAWLLRVVDTSTGVNTGTPLCFGDGSGAACGCSNEDTANPGTGGCLKPKYQPIMRRFVLLFALLLAFAVNAQDTYFTTYSFVVEPQEEATVRQLVDDYYSKNKPEGVFVRLFENHFHDGGNTATHAIVFTGSLDDLSKMYDGGSSESFSLFLTRLNQHIKDGNGSAMGHHLAIYGDTNTRYPFQRYYYLKVKDPAAFVLFSMALKSGFFKKIVVGKSAAEDSTQSSGFFLKRGDGHGKRTAQRKLDRRGPSVPRCPGIVYRRDDRVSRSTAV